MSGNQVLFNFFLLLCKHFTWTFFPKENSFVVRPRDAAVIPLRDSAVILISEKNSNNSNIQIQIKEILSEFKNICIRLFQSSMLQNWVSVAFPKNCREINQTLSLDKKFVHCSQIHFRVAGHSLFWIWNISVSKTK